jgi:HK97 family phage portal protein
MARARDVVKQLVPPIITNLFRAKYVKLPGGVQIPANMSTENLEQSLSSVWAVLQLLCGHLASIPLNLFERLPNGGRRIVQNHPVNQALRWESSPGVPAYMMREALHANIELHGVGYLMPTLGNQRLHLRTFDTNHVQPKRELGVYHIEPPGMAEKAFDVPWRNMIVFPALTFDAKNPVPIRQWRKRSINLAISYERRATSFNQNAVSPSGVAVWGEKYTKLQKEERERLEKKWEEIYQGLENAGGVAFMPPGSEFKPISFHPEQLQMLTSRQYGVQEVARWFGVPPHKVADLSRATFNNIEHLAIEYVQDSLLRRVAKTEAVLTVALIAPEQRGELFIEHNLDGLLRGDFKTRMDGYALAKNAGLLTTNDIHKLENWNPVPEEEGGDTYYMPLNMIPTRELEGMFAGGAGGSGGQGPAIEESVDRASIGYRYARLQATARRTITNRYRSVFGETAGKIVEAETAAVREQMEELLADNKIEEFKSTVAEYYEGLKPDVQKAFLGVLTSYEGEIKPVALEEINSKADVDLSKFIDAYTLTMALRWTGSHRGQILKIVNDSVEASEDPKTNVEQRLGEWEEKEAGKVKRNEPVRAEGAVSVAAWRGAGVQKLRWVTIGDSCPYCQAMDGRVIGISQSFITAGSEFQPEGAETALVPSANIGHPGLHDGCDCSVAAGL